jgi:glycosyltransferase involved in cell wall biosynthesis
MEEKVAILFHRLGPYHVARLTAASRLIRLVAIETSGVDETYAWDKVGGVQPFERLTLFEGADAQKLPRAKVVGQVCSLLDRIRPSVVVVPGWADAAAMGGLRWSAQNGVPSVMLSDSTEWDGARRPWREWVKRRRVGFCSAALVGGNPHKDYIAKLGMPPERVSLGYDVVDNAYFAEMAARCNRPAVDRSINGSERTGAGLHYFLASARFVEKKNLHRLIQAYALYRELVSRAHDGNGKGETWDLVLLGDGPLRGELTAQISDLTLDDHVRLPGFKQYGELPEYYGSAGAFIHASTTEQWGLVVNEAMSSGLPVLVSNRCGCATDLVRSGANGFLFDPSNVNELAELMLKISSSRFPRGAFGEESRRIIAAWGPDRFAQGLKDAVETARQNRRRKFGWGDRLLLELLLR